MLVNTIKALSGGGGTGLIDDYSSVECVSYSNNLGSVNKAVIFENIPETADVIYAYVQGSTEFVVGQSYDLDDYNAGSTYKLNGTIIIDSSGNIEDTFGSLHYTLSGTTLTSGMLTRGVTYGLFKISK